MQHTVAVEFFSLIATMIFLSFFSVIFSVRDAAAVKNSSWYSRRPSCEQQIHIPNNGDTHEVTHLVDERNNWQQLTTAAKKGWHSKESCTEDFRTLLNSA